MITIEIRSQRLGHSQTNQASSRITFRNEILVARERSLHSHLCVELSSISCKLYINTIIVTAFDCMFMLQPRSLKRRDLFSSFSGLTISTLTRRRCSIVLFYCMYMTVHPSHRALLVAKEQTSQAINLDSLHSSSSLRRSSDRRAGHRSARLTSGLRLLSCLLSFSFFRFLASFGSLLASFSFLLGCFGGLCSGRLTRLGISGSG